jgi:hypothetical protein
MQICLPFGLVRRAADRKTPRPVPKSKKDLFPFARIEFANGKERFVVFFDDEVTGKRGPLTLMND